MLKKHFFNKKEKYNKKYNVKFSVCNNDLMPILGLNASKQMKLVELKKKRIFSKYTIYV